MQVFHTPVANPPAGVIARRGPVRHWNTNRALAFSQSRTRQEHKIACQQHHSIVADTSDEVTSPCHHDGRHAISARTSEQHSDPERAVVRLLASALIAAQLITPVAGLLPSEMNTMLMSAPPAHALLLSPDTKVPKNAEVALRRAVPVVNQEMRKIQEELEEVSSLLRIPNRKPYGRMEGNINRAIQLSTSSRDAVLSAVPEASREEAVALFNRLLDDKDGLPGVADAIAAQIPSVVGDRLVASLSTVAQLSLLQATGLQFLIPQQYASLPRLTGRATVVLMVRKGGEEGTFSLANGSVQAREAVVELVLDGFSAPLTAGNFAQKVSAGAYDDVTVVSTSQAVLAEAKAPASPPTDALPLEILPAGEFQPLYRTALDVQDGELPVLPMSVFGAAVMSHTPDSDSYSSTTQFFLYKYDRRSSGLGNLAFDEGQFSVFGYVTKGKDVLAQLASGDLIKSARLVSGEDRLVLP